MLWNDQVIASEQSVQRSALSNWCQPAAEEGSLSRLCRQHKQCPLTIPFDLLSACSLYIFPHFLLPGFFCLLLTSHFKTQERGLGLLHRGCLAAQQPRSQLLILQGLSRWTPSHEKAHAEFSLRWGGFLTLSHIMLPLPTLFLSICVSLSIFSPFFFFLSSDTHTLKTHMLQRVHQGKLRRCIAVSNRTSTFRLHHNHWHLQSVCFYW